MTMLRPKTIPSPYRGDSDYYQSYALVETPTLDGPTVHATAVRAHLALAKANTDWTINVTSIETQVFTTQAPMPEQYYLTTVTFSAIGQPGEIPP